MLCARCQLKNRSLCLCRGAPDNVAAGTRSFIHMPAGGYVYMYTYHGDHRRPSERILEQVAPRRRRYFLERTHARSVPRRRVRRVDNPHWWINRLRVQWEWREDSADKRPESKLICTSADKTRARESPYWIYTYHCLSFQRESVS